jgi:hypothetical protein
MQNYVVGERRNLVAEAGLEREGIGNGRHPAAAAALCSCLPGAPHRQPARAPPTHSSCSAPAAACTAPHQAPWPTPAQLCPPRRWLPHCAAPARSTMGRAPQPRQRQQLPLSLRCLDLDLRRGAVRTMGAGPGSRSKPKCVLQTYSHTFLGLGRTACIAGLATHVMRAECSSGSANNVQKGGAANTAHCFHAICSSILLPIVLQAL